MSELSTLPELGRVLVADDSTDVLLLVAQILQDEFDTVIAKDGCGALSAALSGEVQLVLLDIEMPGMDGFEVCARLKDDPRTAEIPVIFLTARDDVASETRAFRQGAVDFISKPIVPDVLRARVRTHVALSQANASLRDRNVHLEHLVRARTEEVTAFRDAAILAMAALAEIRYSSSANHLRRSSHFVSTLARSVQHYPRFRDELTDDNIHMLFRSAPLHDIGKIAIPDEILFKPGKLTAAEYAIVKRHPETGRDVINSVRRELGEGTEFLRYAAQMTYSHHERYDGSGYPQGLRGDAIPLSARLMAVADVYNAMISRRTYKPVSDHATAMRVLEDGRGTQFDPDIIDGALQVQHVLRDIAARFPDDAGMQQ